MSRVKSLVNRFLARVESGQASMAWRNREKSNIAIITLDSLRFDVAEQATTPNFDRIFDRAGIRGWHKVFSHGTYTLPSHISMFHSGILPCTKDPEAEPIYNRDKAKIFRATLQWNRNQPALYPTPEASNIVKGFEAVGYRTVGVGGVHWFNTQFKTSDFWSDYFEEFSWKESFDQNDPEGFVHQIEHVRRLLDKDRERPLFFFMNVSSTHHPYRRSDGERTVQAQVAAHEYIDAHITELVNLMPKPCHFVIVGDHGECFGEDGLYGHGFYHPKVMEVPMAHFILDAVI